MRRPFFVSLKDYLIGRFSCLLLCLRLEKDEVLLYRNRRRLFDTASKRLLREFDALKLLKQIKKLQVVKQVMMRRSHLKLLKLAKHSTINYEASSDEEEKARPGPLRVLGYIRSIVEGAGQGYEMDQKVLAALIDRKSYNKLANGTLDIKTIRENEIPELLSARKAPKGTKTEESEFRRGKADDFYALIDAKSVFEAPADYTTAKSVGRSKEEMSGIAKKSNMKSSQKEGSAQKLVAQRIGYPFSSSNAPDDSTLLQGSYVGIKDIEDAAEAVVNDEAWQQTNQAYNQS
jgi:hypothetical protein